MRLLPFYQRFLDLNVPESWASFIGDRIASLMHQKQLVYGCSPFTVGVFDVLSCSMLLLRAQVLSMESKCQDFQVNIAALREEISERESVIAQNYTTIQLLRRRLADLEKHKFVLGYRTQVPDHLLCTHPHPYGRNHFDGCRKQHTYRVQSYAAENTIPFYSGAV